MFGATRARPLLDCSFGIHCSPKLSPAEAPPPLYFLEWPCSTIHRPGPPLGPHHIPRLSHSRTVFTGRKSLLFSSPTKAMLINISPSSAIVLMTPDVLALPLPHHPCPFDERGPCFGSHA